jgi:3-oxoacyl-[acyl-carrier protein] reductase
MNTKFDFSNKKVVVTGGAQGIGFAITKMFLTAGAEVAIWDYNEETLKVAESELSSFSDKLKTFRVDVTDAANCNTVAAQTGTIDVLINNAGITRDKSFGKMTHDDFKAVIDTNLTGLFNVTKSFLDQKLFNETSPT